MNEMKGRRLELATLPTPFHRLAALSEKLHTEIWIKRDDLTGFAMGGNKARKAEFIMADVVSQNADVVLTIGAVQSNHALVTATACRRFGKECHLFLAGEKPKQPTGNLLLDHLAGAKIHFVPSFADRHHTMEKFAERLRSEGRKPYLIPLGGSNEIGAQGYAFGFLELCDQFRALPPKPTTLLFASSSGGTFAGLMVGKFLANSDAKLLGIRVDLDPSPEQVISNVANSLAKRFGLSKKFRSDEVHLNSDYAGTDYGISTVGGLKALRDTWQAESILLDPVYTSKAMAGLIDLANNETFADQRVVFLHTGGSPALFSYDSNALIHLAKDERVNGSHA